MDMKHVHTARLCCMSGLHLLAAYPCCMSLLHVHATCPGCISLLHVHTACPCCMSMLHVLLACLLCKSLLHDQGTFHSCMSKPHPCRFSMLHVQAAYPCNMYAYILNDHVLFPCCMSLQHFLAESSCCTPCCIFCPCCMSLNLNLHVLAAYKCSMFTLPVRVACPFRLSILHVRVHAACFSGIVCEGCRKNLLKFSEISGSACKS
jgi:hypothetical protein